MRYGQIDYKEEMGADECMDDGEDSEIDNFSGSEDVETNNSLEEDCNVASKLLAGKSVDNHVDADGSDESKPSPENLHETTDDYSDGWLLSGDDDSADECWNTQNDRQAKTSNEWEVTKNSQSQPQHIPHVKVSALTGVGLQVLLEIIDERLKVQDEKLKSQKVVENSFFDKKWRPPHKEDEDVAVEQR